MAKQTYKRIFSLGFARTAAIPGAGADDAILPLMVAEEDLVIVGFELTTKAPHTGFIANDGICSVDFVLTTSGLVVGAGVVGWLDCVEIWNTAPAAIDLEMPALAVIFPEGHGISMKEGETLSLYHAGNNTSAAEVRVTIDGTVYYVKGSGVS